jgi:hypothetical protein
MRGREEAHTREEASFTEHWGFSVLTRFVYLVHVCGLDETGYSQSAESEWACRAKNASACDGQRSTLRNLAR